MSSIVFLHVELFERNMHLSFQISYLQCRLFIFTFAFVYDQIFIYFLHSLAFSAMDSPESRTSEAEIEEVGPRNRFNRRVRPRASAVANPDEDQEVTGSAQQEALLSGDFGEAAQSVLRSYQVVTGGVPHKVLDHEGNEIEQITKRCRRVTSFDTLHVIGNSGRFLHFEGCSMLTQADSLGMELVPITHCICVSEMCTRTEYVQDTHGKLHISRWCRFLKGMMKTEMCACGGCIP